MSPPHEPGDEQKWSNLYDIVEYKPSSQIIQHQNDGFSERTDLNSTFFALRGLTNRSLYTTWVVAACIGITTWNLSQITRNGQSEASLGLYLSQSRIFRPPCVKATLDGTSRKLAWSPLAQANAIGKFTKQMLSGILTEKDEEHVAVDNSRDLGYVPMAHLVSDYFLTSFPNTTDVTRWRLDRKLGAYIVGNMSYDSYDGGLAIERSGLYFLYSQVNFIMAERDRPLNRPSTVKHELVRRPVVVGKASDGSTMSDNDKEVVLLKAERTQSWARAGRGGASEQCAMESSRIGSLVPLKRGDRVLVRVTDVNYIWQSPRRAIVGALYVSD